MATSKNTKAGSKSNGGMIAAIIAIVAVVIIAVVVAVVIISKDDKEVDSGNSDDTSKVEDKKETEIETFGDASEKFTLEVPTSLSKMSESELKENFSDGSVNAAFTNSDNTVNLAISTTSESLDDDMIEEYTDTMESVMGSAGENVKTETYTVDGHKVGRLEIDLKDSGDDEAIFTNMLFFSYDGNLAMIVFNCDEAHRSEWVSKGNTILKSLKFKN